tara:strand:- start:1745 stop:1966 length:222 start_codon:yes stop_codon:yes gene_type:complete
MQLGKISSIRTIALVAKELGEDEDWLFDIAGKMEPEDGLIWVYSAGHPEGTKAFSPYGVNCLREIIQCHREDS